MIRWITDELGTAPFTDSEISDDLNVLDVRDLVDKHGNSPEATREKIDQEYRCFSRAVGWWSAVTMAFHAAMPLQRGFYPRSQGYHWKQRFGKS